MIRSLTNIQEPKCLRFFRCKGAFSAQCPSLALQVMRLSHICFHRDHRFGMFMIIEFVLTVVDDANTGWINLREAATSEKGERVRHRC